MCVGVLVILFGFFLSFFDKKENSTLKIDPNLPVTDEKEEDLDSKNSTVGYRCRQEKIPITMLPVTGKELEVSGTLQSDYYFDIEEGTVCHGVSEMVYSFETRSDYDNFINALELESISMVSLGYREEFEPENLTLRYQSNMVIVENGKLDTSNVDSLKYLSSLKNMGFTCTKVTLESEKKEG